MKDLKLQEIEAIKESTILLRLYLNITFTFLMVLLSGFFSFMFIDISNNIKIAIGFFGSILIMITLILIRIMHTKIQFKIKELL